MCGIIAGFNLQEPEPINEFIINQLENQISRGSQGFGILMIKDNLKVELYRATTLAKTHVDLALNQAKMILLHHRFPTSTSNRLQFNHPIVVDNGSLEYKYYVIHNGVISNADTLKIEHEKLGFQYTTCESKTAFNDSEAFAVDLARFIEKQTDTISAQGTVAFLLLQVEKKTNTALKLFFGRNTNPLNLAKNTKTIRISSEGPGNEIKSNTLYNFNFQNFKLTKKNVIFPETPIAPIIPYSYTGFTGFNHKPKPWAFKHPNNCTCVACTNSYQQQNLGFEDNDVNDFAMENIQEELELRTSEIIAAFIVQLAIDPNIDNRTFVVEFETELIQASINMTEALTAQKEIKPKAKKANDPVVSYGY